jgi:hypothetical protein
MNTMLICCVEADDHRMKTDNLSCGKIEERI